MSRAAILSFLIVDIVVIVIVLAIVMWFRPQRDSKPSRSMALFDLPLASTATPTVSPTPTLMPLPPSAQLTNDYHIIQSFNNCGPAALSMALSHYGINASQQELGLALRPYQNPQGDNDDKSTTLEELAEKSKDYNFTPYHRPVGNSDLVKQFVALGLPVITRTLLHAGEDIGHYRVITGYDDASGEFIQDDSLQGKNLHYSYGEFDQLWAPFNYEYLVLVLPDKKVQAEAILGPDIDEATAWKKSVALARQELQSNPSDIYAGLSLSVALYHLGRYEESIAEYEKIEGRLPWRTLWYQIEPIEAYYAVGNYDRVFSLTDSILNNYNRAFSELYILRGRVYEKQGRPAEARAEYEKAVFYNQNSSAAKAALAQTQ